MQLLSSCTHPAPFLSARFMASNNYNGEPSRGNSSVTVRSESGNGPVLSENLRRLRAMGPQESLGVNDEGGLLMPVLQASVVTLVILAALTVIPYFLQSPPAPKPTKPEVTENAEVAPPPRPVDKDKEAVAKKNNDAAPVVDKTPPAKKDIIDNLGENKSKKADPKVNPFENKDIDLLKN